jgi:hypothetical protein
VFVGSKTTSPTPKRAWVGVDTPKLTTRASNKAGFVAILFVTEVVIEFLKKTSLRK